MNESKYVGCGAKREEDAVGTVYTLCACGVYMYNGLTHVDRSTKDMFIE